MKPRQRSLASDGFRAVRLRLSLSCLTGENLQGNAPRESGQRPVLASSAVLLDVHTIELSHTPRETLLHLPRGQFCSPVHKSSLGTGLAHLSIHLTISYHYPARITIPCSHAFFPLQRHLALTGRVKRSDEITLFGPTLTLIIAALVRADVGAALFPHARDFVMAVGVAQPVLQALGLADIERAPSTGLCLFDEHVITGLIRELESNLENPILVLSTRLSRPHDLRCICHRS